MLKETTFKSNTEWLSLCEVCHLQVSFSLFQRAHSVCCFCRTLCKSLQTCCPTLQSFQLICVSWVNVVRMLKKLTPQTSKKKKDWMYSISNNFSVTQSHRKMCNSYSMLVYCKMHYIHRYGLKYRHNDVVALKPLLCICLEEEMNAFGSLSY